MKFDNLCLLGSVYQRCNNAGKYSSNGNLFYFLLFPYGRKYGYLVAKESIYDGIFINVYFYLPVIIDFLLSY